MKLSDIHNISIKWKLLIPFLFLALLGTFSLIFLSIRFQEKTFLSQEKNHLECLQKTFLSKVSENSFLALTLAKEISSDDCVGRALARKDLSKLKLICNRSHRSIKNYFKSLGWYILLLNNSGKVIESFARRDRGLPDDFAKILPEIKSESSLVLVDRKVLICSAVGIYYDKHQVGNVVIVIPINRRFLQNFASVFGVQVTIVTFDKKRGTFEILATSKPHRTINPEIYRNLDQSRLPYFSVSPPGLSNTAVFIASLKDHNTNIPALLEITADRSESLMLLAEYKKNMILVGVAGFLLSLGIIFWITIIFTRPIGKLVEAAQEIASGRAIKEIKLKYRDEIGILAESLNEMLKSLQESHCQIRDYAENLERKVRERTRALTQSEEKYRTLVENVPLVVYRTDSSGALTFVNRYVENLLGFPVAEVLSKKDFLLSRIVDEDREVYLKHWERCLKEGKEFEIEYRMLDSDNQLVYVVDHAIPESGSDGKVTSVDGIIVDVTDRRKAQEKRLQAEELKALREISSRLAHEIRNPLMVAGGFARQLLKSVPPDDPAHKKLEIISTEIQRLENILKTTLEYIKPRVLKFEETDLNRLIEPVVENYTKWFNESGVTVKTSLDPSIPALKLDPSLFAQVIRNILDLFVQLLPEGAQLAIETYCENNYVILAMRLEGAELKLEKFDPLLSPFSSAVEKGLPVGLPLTKIIIEKHNGLLKIEKLGKHTYSLTISIPIPKW